MYQNLMLHMLVCRNNRSLYYLERFGTVLELMPTLLRSADTTESLPMFMVAFAPLVCPRESHLAWEMPITPVRRNPLSLG